MIIFSPLKHIEYFNRRSEYLMLDLTLATLEKMESELNKMKETVSAIESLYEFKLNQGRTTKAIELVRTDILNLKTELAGSIEPKED